MISNYYKYYTEIKNRFLLIAFTWVFCLSTCYSYKEAILFTIINSNSSFAEIKNETYFIFTNVTEVFHVYLELILFTANQFTIFVLLYQTLMFFSLGLYKFEFEKLKLGVKIFITSWLASTALLYKFIIPFSWDFFLSFQGSSEMIQQPISFFFEAKLTEYFYFFTSLYYICLINCQFLTLLIIGLTSLNERSEKTKTFRKLFYLIFITFSTIITPPDVLSQVCIGSFLIMCYEFVVLLKYVRTSMVTS
jgi:sec-independent protein translocase protein TatC